MADSPALIPGESPPEPAPLEAVSAPEPDRVVADVSVPYPVVLDEHAGMAFVRIPGGCFRMGSDRGAGDEQPVHEVCVHQDGDFLIGQYEVTQAQWQAVMGMNPALSRRGERFPVENVSWNDIQAFLARLNEAGTGRYRLPTEAEWEYAARAGGQGDYWWGDETPVCDPGQRHGANIDGLRCPGATQEVGSYPANPFGLYEMHGNVWEWVEDAYAATAYLHHARQDPVATGDGDQRVFRGGSWLYPAEAARAARRDHHMPDFNFSHLGLRLIHEPPE